MAEREFTLKVILRAVDAMTAPARKGAKALADMAKRAKLDRLNRGLRKVRENLARVAAMGRRAGKSLRDVGGKALTRITAPLALVAGFALKAAAQLETMEVSFVSMLGTAEKARAMVKRLTDFAASTPFQLGDIGKAAKQLLSFGVAGAKIVGRLKLLGDIAAGANVPLTDMAAIFGKAKAKGKAMTEELLQLSDRGIPIIDALAKKLKRPKTAIFELASKGKISFDLLKAALRSMVGQGGIFADQMKKQSETLAGIFSTLKDNVFIAMGEIGAQLVETFALKENMKALIVWIQEMTAKFREFAKTHPLMTKTVFILGAVASAVGVVTIAVGALAAVVGVLATGLTVLFSPIVAIIVGIFALVAALAVAAYLIYDNWGDIVEFFKNLWNKALLYATAYVKGLLNLFATFNPVLLLTKGVQALVKYLFGVDLMHVGRKWMDSLGQGIFDGWENITKWLGEAITALVDWMPDWVKGRLGISGGGTGALAGAALPVPSALGPQQSQIGGSLDVRFHNAPAGMRVEKVQSRTPGFDIDADSGPMLAGMSP